MIEFLFLLIGFCCFVAAFFRFRPDRTIPAGLAAWILVALIGAWPS